MSVVVFMKLRIQSTDDLLSDSQTSLFPPASSNIPFPLFQPAVKKRKEIKSLMTAGWKGKGSWMVGRWVKERNVLWAHICFVIIEEWEKRTKQICLSPELLFSPIPFIREPVGHILGSLKQSCPTGSRLKAIGEALTVGLSSFPHFSWAPKEP